MKEVEQKEAAMSTLLTRSLNELASRAASRAERARGIRGALLGEIPPECGPADDSGVPAGIMACWLSSTVTTHRHLTRLADDLAEIERALAIEPKGGDA